MTFEQRGLYHHLLIWQWQSDGCLLNADAVQALCGGISEGILAPVLKCFEQTDGKIYNKKMLEIWRHQRAKSREASHSARLRWHAKAYAKARNPHMLPEPEPEPEPEPKRREEEYSPQGGGKLDDPEKKTPRTTWLTEYEAVHEKNCGVVLNHGEWATAIKGLLRVHQKEKIIVHLTNYYTFPDSKDKPSISYFAKTFNRYANRYNGR